MVCSLRRSVPDPADLEPEHLAVIRLCRNPASVADLASALDLPLGVIRILLADLRDRGLVGIRRRPERLTDIRLLRQVADGLRRL
jgi:DNA-binding transcriptional ArsR family regulator